MLEVADGVGCSIVSVKDCVADVLKSLVSVALALAENDILREIV